MFLSALLYSITLREKLYFAFVDKNKSGDYFYQDEKNVKLYLEKIMENPGRYAVKAYTRTVVPFQLKKTKLAYHTFYVIFTSGGEYHTLSFYGTVMDFFSEGAWVWDADSDTFAYTAFTKGRRKWDVEEVYFINGLDTEKTIGNIIKKIDSDVKYYYADHVKKLFNMNSCNTAFDETLAEKEME